MKKLPERILSLTLSALTVASMVTVAAQSISAAAENKKAVAEDYSKKTAQAYTLDEIYTDYLFSHTAKTSEKTSSTLKKGTGNANSDQTYSDFGFSQVSDKAANEQLSDDETDNPLSGYTFINPSELLIGQINRNSQHKGYIRTINNITSNVNELNPSIDSLDKAFEDSALEETKAGQTHNTIGIDYNGDGVDELAYFSLYYDQKGCASVRTYNRVKSTNGSNTSYSWQKAGEHGIAISKNNDLLDIEAQQSKGYTSMAAGDFDGDGKEELACYFPCANDGYGEPYIGIIDINDKGEFNLKKMTKIMLSSIRSEFANLQNDGKNNFEKYYMPVVALSTTSIRANGNDVNEKSYDDLVINVSVPRVYHDNNVNMNSCVAIYTYKNKSYTKAFSSDLKYSTERMLSTNSVDADLNGDGYNELVIAGIRETGLDKSNNQSTGNISKTNNLIQLIYWDGSNYKFVWNTPKTVEASGQVKVNRSSQEPIALTAGRYDPNVPLTMDYICVQGVVLSCQSTKVYGVEVTAAKDTDIGKAVIETKPYKESELFSAATFNTEYKTDIAKLVSAKDNAFISTASSGAFYATSNLDTIVLLTGDEVKSSKDNISYDIILLSCDESGKWISKAYDDYISHKDEDDQGTYASVCFLDCDEDQMYYRYKGKAVGYSSPTLYSIVQTPPYYSENNDASVSCTITNNTADGVKLTWGTGGGISINGAGSGVVKYIGSYTHTTVHTKSTTLNLKTDQDYAVAFVVPVIFSYYDVWDPEIEAWTDMVTTTMLEATFAALPLEQYNSLAKSLSKEQQIQAPVITADMLPDSCAGDPSEYFRSSKEVKTKVGVKNFDETFVTVNTDTKSKANSIGVTVNEEQTHGFSVSVSVTIKKIFTFNTDISTAAISSKSIGISFSATYSAIKASNTARINDSTSSSYRSLKAMKSSITHYQPVDYIYYSHAMTYLANEMLISRYPEKYNELQCMNDIYILSFYTDNMATKRPAELPEYFGVQSVSENSDGTYNITLGWKTEVQNQSRKPDAYNIYVKSLNSNMAELVNKEGPIYYSDSSAIKTYTAKSLKNSKDDYVFYIAAAYTSTSGNASDKTVNVTESILSSGVSVNIDSFMKADTITIARQPSSFFAASTGQTAEFSVSAVSKGKGDLYYQWQTYNSKAGKWVNVDQSHFTDTSKYSFTVTDSSYYVPVRCVITESLSAAENYTKISDVVTVYKEHTHNYGDDGFCTLYGCCEPAVKNSKTSVYQISNAGQLFWFAALVNGESGVEGVSTKTSDAKAELTADIDLDEKAWTPIKDFAGAFNGNSHIISGISIQAYNDNSGFFANINKATVKDLSLEGCMMILCDGSNYGSLAGFAENSDISGISSSFTVSNADNAANSNVGGIIGSAIGKDSKISGCVFSGEITLNGSTQSAGNIVGYDETGTNSDTDVNLGGNMFPNTLLGNTNTTEAAGSSSNESTEPVDIDVVKTGSTLGISVLLSALALATAALVFVKKKKLY